MEHNGYRIEVVVNGVPLSERADGVVLVPFGSEYALRFTPPQDGLRHVARVKIDGKAVAEGGLVIGPYGGQTLERPVAGSDKKFRFASVDSPAAYAAGKGGADTDGRKGLISVEFFAERERPVAVASPAVEYLERGVPEPRDGAGEELLEGQSMSMGSPTRSYSPRPDVSARRIIVNDGPSNIDLKSGVTVEGSKSSQQFKYVDLDLESTSTLLTIKLMGYEEAAPLPSAMPSQCNPLKW